MGRTFYVVPGDKLIDLWVIISMVVLCNSVVLCSLFFLFVIMEHDGRRLLLPYVTTV